MAKKTKTLVKMTEVKKISVGILFYSGAQNSAILGLTDLFNFANDIGIDGRSDGMSALHCSFEVSCWRQGKNGLKNELGDANADLDVLIIPPSYDARKMQHSLPEFSSWLVRLHSEGVLICSICAGAFILAETGLLDNRHATTHWALRERFETEYPTVLTDVDRLIIDEGDIVTAGGMMAWIDLGLRLVSRFMGTAVMQNLAKLLLVDPGEREQIFYCTFSPQLRHGDRMVLKTQHWLQKNFTSQVSISTLSKIAQVGERTFLRRFQKATGHTPTAYIQALRVSKAKELIEMSKLSVERTAWEVGYSDVSAFHVVFRKFTGLTPGEYRRRFNSNAHFI